MQLAIATVPDAMLGTMLDADVPMFLATYEVFEYVVMLAHHKG